MLESLRLIDFKSFVDETIPFSPVTYLVGANAVGKSNVLDALRVLRQMPFHPRTKPMPGMRVPPPDPWRGIRGGPRELARRGTDGFAIHDRSALFAHTHGITATVVRRLRCETNPAPRLLEETFVDEALRPIEPDPFEELMLGFSLAYAFMCFVDIRPERMLSHDTDGCLYSDCAGDLCVLKSMLRRRRSRFRDPFIEWAAALCAPGLCDVELVEHDGPDGVEVVLVERDGSRISARSMSEGDLRCLGLLTVLLGPRKPGIVCLEDPTAGLHPSRARLLIELFQAIARDEQVIVTTHDASLLQWLDDERLAQVVLLARTSEHAGTVARRLGDLPGFFDAKRSLGLEEMIATEWLEAAL